MTAPDPLDRYADAVGVPRDAALVRASGGGGFRQPLAGRRGIWLPMRWEVHLVPPTDFVFLAEVRIAGVRVLRGGDEFKDGRGRFRMGRRVLDGREVDRAEYTALVAWTLAFAPAAFAAAPGVVSEPSGADETRVSFPYGTETWAATLRFDPESGLLRRLETHRADLRGGSRRWSAELEWTSRDGRPAARRILTLWEEEPAVRIDVDAVEATRAG